MSPALRGRGGFVGIHDAFGRWQPKGVIFDCDGLLMDTESLWALTQCRVSEARGVLFDEEFRRSLVGLPASRVGPAIAARAGVNPALVIDELLQTNLAMVLESAVPMPGARRFVEAASSRVGTAVASNSARRILDATLHRSDFSEAFSVIVSADEVARPKPAPDLYLASARALNLDPEDCLAFEDSETGARAAQAAGMKVIAIPSRGQIPPANLTRDSLEAADLLLWVEEWRATAAAAEQRPAG